MWQRMRRHAGVLGVVAAIVSAVTGSGVAHAAGADAPTLAEQLSALPRSAGVSGLDPSLAAVARARTASAGVAIARSEGLAVQASRVRVIVESSSSATASSAVSDAGGSIEGRYGDLTQALVPTTSLKELVAAPGVDLARPPELFRPTAAGDTEGIASLNATAWHSSGLTGAGVKVAVIDIGFADWSSDGNLAGATPVTNFCTSSEFNGPNADPHGHAVADIVHQTAPGAQLYLICVDSEVALGQAKDYAVANNIKIVNHSVGWYATSRGDGSGDAGTPDAIVADARANGILWVNAAGNDARNHWSGTFADPDGDGLANLSGDDEGNNVTIPAGAGGCAALRWDAWPVTSQDYDLVLVRSSTGEIVAAGADDQSKGPSTPTEMLCYQNAGATDSFALVIARYSATSSPRLDLWYTGASPLEYRTAAGSVVDPASSPAAVAVGAVCWADGTLEPYSAQGPTIDGRTKPELVGPDKTSSPVYGTSTGCGAGPGFPGTSAAAPHVAGAAALLAQQNPAATPAQLQSLLERHVSEAGEPTNTIGVGSLWLHAPVTGHPLAFANGQIGVANTDGSNETLLTTDPSGADLPAFSPDGTKIAFVSAVDGNANIYVMNANGTNRVELTTDLAQDTTPAWSPDGTKLAFASTRAGNSDLYVMNADGTGSPTQLTTDTLNQFDPTWAGAKIAFSGETAVSGGGTRNDIYTMNANGTGVINLTNGTWAASKTQPSFSPDGTKIAFVASTPMQPTLYVMNADGTAQASITAGAGAVSWPGWNAGGTRLLFASAAGGASNDLYAIDLSGTALLRLTKTASPEQKPSPSAAGSVPFAAMVPLVVGDSAPRVGQPLTALQPAWIGDTPLTTSFQWERCDAGGGSCTPIFRAIESYYIPAVGDIGGSIRVVATATGTGLAGTKVSTATAVVVGALPVNTVLPALGGTLQQGATLTSTTGTWANAPTAFLRQWRRCGSAGGDCLDIAGATGTSYQLAAADVGATIRVAVTGTNTSGSGPAASVASTLVAASPGGGGSGASGGGGGGGSSVPDLKVSIAAKATALSSNATDDLVVTVSNLGGAGSLQTHLAIALPATMTLLGPPAFDRGSGCAGTQTIDCFLDYLPNGGASKVLFSIRVTGTGAQSLTATASADREANAADNAATLTLQVGSTPPLASPPVSTPPIAVPSTRPRTVVGTARANTIGGTALNDVLRGLGGNDSLYGRGGDDLLDGGTGNDLVDGGSGIDRLLGGAGNDTIWAQDGRRDTVDCGAGRDVAHVDRADRVSHCERVLRR